MELLEQEIARVKDTGNPASVLMLDLDNFKYVNDVLGHGTGDALLRLVAAAVNESVRDSDHLARIGGDEFAVLLPGTTVDGALLVAEKLVDAVAEHGHIIERDRSRRGDCVGWRDRMGRQRADGCAAGAGRGRHRHVRRQGGRSQPCRLLRARPAAPARDQAPQ